MLVLDQLDIRASLPALELERARADRRIVVRILRQGRIHVVEMLGQDDTAADIEGIQKGGVAFLQAENNGVVVGRGDVLDIAHQ
ncbi:hypothetical protein D9M68_912030 [compost metagenome]